MLATALGGHRGLGLVSSVMRVGWRVRLVAVAVLAGGSGLVSSPGASGAAKESTPPRGWVVDRVRLENLSADRFLTVGGTGDVRGVVDVVPGPGGLAVVNELALDDYLRGVSEVPSDWPTEAQRAQAIAARTFALHEMQRQADTEAKAVGAHICATQQCQVYLGVAKERSEKGDRWVSAVDSTRNQVLLYQGEPILAMYSSSNGGRSVAGGRPYLRAVNDPESAKGPYNHWTVRFGFGDLASAFRLPGALLSVERNGEGIALDWKAPDGSTGQTFLPVAGFRDTLNATLPAQADLPRAVPSTQFSVSSDAPSATVTLDGKGNGHGIGLSQFGALGKALRGQRAGDILASYYGGLRPVTAAPETLPPTIRVALVTGQHAVSVGGTGRFRVVDGSGAPLAVAAHGMWRIQSAGNGKLRVVAPVDQEPAPAVGSLVVVGPAAKVPAGEARFQLGTAAAVHLRVEGTALATPLETTTALVEPGPAAVTLPPLPAVGRYSVSVLADAGAGRVTAVTAPLRVRTLVPAGTAATAGTAPTPELPRPAALAWALLLVVTTALVRVAWPFGARRPAHARRSAPFRRYRLD